MDAISFVKRLSLITISVLVCLIVVHRERIVVLLPARLVHPLGGQFAVLLDFLNERVELFELLVH